MAALCPVDICVHVVAVLILAYASVDVASVEVLDSLVVWDDDVPICSDMVIVYTPV